LSPFVNPALPQADPISKQALHLVSLCYKRSTIINHLTLINMKKLFSLLTIGACVAFASCSKDKNLTGIPGNEQPPTLNEKLLVKTVTTYNEVTCEYYPDRKIKAIIETSQFNPERRTEFSHTPGAVTLTEFSLNKKTQGWVYFLDNNGRCTGTKYYDYNDNGDVIAESSAICTYNTAGQLIREDFGGDNYEEYFYVNGNLDIYKSYKAGVCDWEAKYEYYTDKPEKLISCGQFNNKGLGGIRPTLSKHMLKRRLVRNPAINTILHDIAYSYEFDAQGFVTKGKYVNSVGNITHEWTNTFQ
jgi:antitoxin component YwqK of YwqJK toxin-antitoxin module